MELKAIFKAFSSTYMYVYVYFKIKGDCSLNALKFKHLKRMHIMYL